MCIYIYIEREREIDCIHMIVLCCIAWCSIVLYLQHGLPYFALRYASYADVWIVSYHYVHARSKLCSSPRLICIYVCIYIYIYIYIAYILRIYYIISYTERLYSVCIYIYAYIYIHIHIHIYICISGRPALGPQGPRAAAAGRPLRRGAPREVRALMYIYIYIIHARCVYIYIYIYNTYIHTHLHVYIYIYTCIYYIHKIITIIDLTTGETIDETKCLDTHITYKGLWQGAPSGGYAAVRRCRDCHHSCSHCW